MVLVVVVMRYTETAGVTDIWWELGGAVGGCEGEMGVRVGVRVNAEGKGGGDCRADAARTVADSVVRNIEYSPHTWYCT